MDKKGCWILIILALALNVVMLQWTVEAYFGEEYSKVYLYTGISMVSVLITLFAYFKWRKVEYK